MSIEEQLQARIRELEAEKRDLYDALKDASEGRWAKANAILGTH
jgi:hypothetical protein